MADIVYNTGGSELGPDHVIDWEATTLKVMLVDSTYTADKDDDVVDNAGASDPIDAEVSGTGYIGGWGGSGRKTIANPTITVDKANDQIELDCDDITWTGISVGTVAAAIIIKEGASDDTDSRLIAYFDTSFPIVTDGSNLNLVFPSDGAIKLTT